jgi:hypothetical protein
VVTGLAVSIVRDFYAGRLGVDAIALVSMSAALLLRQPLTGAVVALMYSGGNVLEEIAVARAEHDLRSLVDRAPRTAHRRVDARDLIVQETGHACSRRRASRSSLPDRSFIERTGAGAGRRPGRSGEMCGHRP